MRHIHMCGTESQNKARCPLHSYGHLNAMKKDSMRPKFISASAWAKQTSSARNTVYVAYNIKQTSLNFINCCDNFEHKTIIYYANIKLLTKRKKKMLKQTNYFHFFPFWFQMKEILATLYRWSIVSES